MKLGNILHTARLEGKNDLDPADLEQFIINAAWVVFFHHHTIFGFSPGTAIFG